jgi:CubicO group peptidase (beta-lactamase class C family)
VLVGIIDGDSTYQLSLGRKINPEGIFELGSVTKPVVAWLINEALVSMNMDRHVSVCTFLPDSLCGKSWMNLTYDQVIEHKTGLMRLPPGIGEIESDVQDPYKDYTIHLFANDLKLLQPTVGTYSYSHIGYALTHWLFEKAGGLSDYTKKNLSIPFSMNDTGWEYAPNEIEPGHGLNGRPQPSWNTNALEPALGLKSSMQDMLTFVGLLFDGYDRNHRKQAPGALKKELKSLSKTGAYKVVDGWFVIRAAKSLVYYHNGRTGGHHISVAFTPHLKKGVVVIANGAMGTNDLSLLILRMINQAKKSRKS